MADAGLFIGWGAPVRGREAKGLEVFSEALAYYARLQQEGVIEGFETAILEPHGGDLQGFVLVRGSEERLAQLRVDDEFVRLSARKSDHRGRGRDRRGARRRARRRDWHLPAGNLRPDLATARPGRNCRRRSVG